MSTSITHFDEITGYLKNMSQSELLAVAKKENMHPRGPMQDFIKRLGRRLSKSPPRKTLFDSDGYEIEAPTEGLMERLRSSSSHSVAAAGEGTRVSRALPRNKKAACPDRPERHYPTPESEMPPGQVQSTRVSMPLMPQAPLPSQNTPEHATAAAAAGRPRSSSHRDWVPERQDARPARRAYQLTCGEVDNILASITDPTNAIPRAVEALQNIELVARDLRMKVESIAAVATESTCIRLVMEDVVMKNLKDDPSLTDGSRVEEERRIDGAEEHQRLTSRDRDAEDTSGAARTNDGNVLTPSAGGSCLTSRKRRRDDEEPGATSKRRR